jgi:hypothetical protein
MMRASRDRWPAILSGEQEQILAVAGFHYDRESGVLVHTELRKALSVEAAAEHGAEELRNFVRKKSAPGQAQIVVEGAAAPILRESLLRRYGW